MLEQLEFKYHTSRFILIFGLTVVYFLAGKLSLNLAFLNPSASPVWPPTGIAIASFILWGYRIWPAIFLGAFFVNVTTTGAVYSSIGIASGNTLEGVVSLYLINKFVGSKKIFDKPVNVFKYIVLAGILSTAVSSTFGTISLYLSGFIKPGNHFYVWLTWWLGDIGGALIVAPVILLWAFDNKIKWKASRVFEALIVLFLLLSSAYLIFSGQLPASLSSYPLAFVTIPMLVWIAYRFSPRSTATSILALALIAVLGTMNQTGPFSNGDPNQSLATLQIFMGIIFFAVMPLSTGVIRQKQTEEVLRESEERYRTLADTASDAIITINEKSKILFCNPSVQKIFGYSSKELFGKDLTVIIPDRLKNTHKTAIASYVKTGKQNIQWAAVELPGLHKDGTEIPLEISFSKFSKNGSIIFTGIIRDITERKNAEARIKNSLKEKEVLLREIHHRVKNNLQIISSLINLQTEKQTDNTVKELLKSSKYRIRSMSLIHERLYKSNNISELFFNEYVTELTREILQSNYSSNVKIEIDMPETILNPDLAIYLGMIINEIVSNSIRHAFNNISNQKITISFFKKDKTYILIIKDNGNGFPPGFNITNAETLGMQLILNLINQINGKLELNSNMGVEYKIIFNTD